MNELTDRGKAFRTAIAGFIDTRREAKLKGKEDNAEAASKYDYTTWLAGAARRVGQIQAVTHVLKATHPDARGSSLHVAPPSLTQHAEIGSHLLGADYAEDVVGNAAALDVFKLLKLEIEGKRLLDWMQAGDTDLQAALSGDAAQAHDWMQAFASLVREDAAPSTHPMAKQLYWLAGDTPQDDGHYHLLQPMFASSLAQAVHADIQDARFSEASKAARQARRDNKPADAIYRDYRGLAVRKLGGTKPQNISQLNSDRLGMNYLLASLPPPAWKPRDGVNPLGRETVFGDHHSVFLYFGEVRQLIRELADFLKTDPDANKEARERVGMFTHAIAEVLALFGAEVRGRYAAGWTHDEACRLPLCEQLWLDPDRTELPPRGAVDANGYADDFVFNAAYEQGDWVDEVAGRFGRWLNDQLRQRSDKLKTLGETEMRHFARQAILDVAWPIPLQRRAKVGAA